VNHSPEKGPMHIAFVCHGSMGGSGVVARQLASAMAARGHRTWLLTPRHDEHPSPAGVETIHVQTPDYPVLDHPPVTLAMASALLALHERVGLHVVHVHYALPWSVSAWMAQQMSGGAFRVMHTLHGTDVTGIGSDPAYAPTLRYVLEQADCLTTPSLSLKEDVGRTFGSDIGNRTFVVPNGVDAERFTSVSSATRAPLRHRLWPGGDDDAWLIHVSNFRPVKQVHLVVEAFASVAAKCSARLIMIGDGPDRERAEQLVAGRGLNDRVLWIPGVSDTTPWLQASDVFLLPSRTESFGLAALEAMACGVPVVAFRVGGIPEVVADGVCGSLLDASAAEDLAAVAMQWAHTPNREQVAASCRQHAMEHFALTQIAEQWQRHYCACFQGVM
jgi:L-malate glycosyltransferase